MNFDNDEQPDLGSPIHPIMSHNTESEQMTPTIHNESTIMINSSSESYIQSPENSMEVSPSWDPMAISTPIITTAPRSEKDIENELFHDIQVIVRNFIRHPNRHYPYYRVMRWFEGDDPKLEHILTVVINRPTIISERQ